MFNNFEMHMSSIQLLKCPIFIKIIIINRLRRMKRRENSHEQSSKDGKVQKKIQFN